MTELATHKCVPCEAGSVRMPFDEAQRRLVDVPGWNLSADAKKIDRNFKVLDFVSALKLVNRIGEVAEQEGHHPDIFFGWGYVHVTFHTHAVKGLSENDFIMAAKLNDLAA
jgi:4a-hydroxytetrahydrobiopterin dehydratase